MASAGIPRCAIVIATQLLPALWSPNMLALLLIALSTYKQPSVVLQYAPADTGMGRCGSMDQHWHNEDGACHRDSDDSVALVVRP